MDKTTILVTGGAGFIGSHLCEALAEDPQHVVVSLDDYSSGSPANHVSRVTYLRGRTEDIEKHVLQIPNVIFHLGEYSRVERSFDDIRRVIVTNILGTFRVLEFAREHGAKLIYVGSSTRFADGERGRNQSPYAWTKAANAELVKNYGDWFGLKYAIAYCYNVYGPRQIAVGPLATVIGIFSEKLRNKEPLPVVRPGTQRRNFTHVSDIVSGLVLVGARGHGDNYGLGSEEKVSILEAATLFGGPIVMVPEHRGNRMDAELDLTRSRDELGWQAQRRLVDYIRDLKENQD